MKKSILFLGVGLSLAVPLKATTLTFDTSSSTTAGYAANGITPSSGVNFSAIGGGHLFLNGYNNDDTLCFASPTYVNSFQMNFAAWQGHVPPTGMPSTAKLDIAGFNSSNQKIWSTTVDLKNYTDWTQWLKVDVSTFDVSKLLFYAPNVTEHNIFYPSIDNLVLNEPPPPKNLRNFAPLVDTHVPDAGSSAALMGLATLGIAAVRRKLS